MDYFTVDGVILRTGYKNKRDWYLLPIRELLDNSADFLWKYYKGSDNAAISVSVHMDNDYFVLTLRNSNAANKSVFSDLKPIFDYDMRYGSKQDVHIISRGMLGDALKQVLSLGYVLLHTRDDGTSFTDLQWKLPLTIRHNGKESNVFLTVDKATQSWERVIEHIPEDLNHTDTEIAVILPVIDEVRNLLDRNYIEQFCRKYSLLTTDISFKFEIIDDITHSTITEDEQGHEDDDDDEGVLNTKTLSTMLSTVPEKGILNIDVPSIHPIASQWSNSDFVHSYKPEEFKGRITNVHNKDSTSVYDVLVTFREGSNIKKSPKNQISVAQLLKKPNRDKMIERLYNQLRKAIPPPQELLLPYTTNTKKRCEVLVNRIAKLYDIDTTKKPSYKLVRGVYTDDNIRTLQYPIAFEIIAIPFKEPYGPGNAWDEPKPHVFIGAVNYSISPKNNNFEGDYGIVKGRYTQGDISGVLRNHGFEEYGASRNKLPSIIVGNLITPRREPQGYDKSSIDTGPFIDLIKLAVERMAPEIQTYRAAGYTFSGRDDKDVSKHDINRRINATNLLRQFLIEERGLPELDNAVVDQDEEQHEEEEE